jgi:hypothetical protein
MELVKHRVAGAIIFIDFTLQGRFLSSLILFFLFAFLVGRLKGGQRQAGDGFSRMEKLGWRRG